MNPEGTYRYIECTYTAGMFPSEYIVTIRLHDQELSLFAPKESVKEMEQPEGKGLLQVRLIDPRHNVFILPGQTVPDGRQYYEIPDELLKSA